MEPKVICTGSTSNVSKFTGKTINCMTFFEMPSSDQFKKWWAEGHGVYYMQETEDGTKLWPVDGASLSVITAVVNGKLEYLTSREAPTIFVMYEESLSDDSYRFIQRVLGTNDNHVPVIFPGNEETSNNIGYYRWPEHGPLRHINPAAPDDVTQYRYAGIDFIVSPKSIYEHQLYMMGRQARMWMNNVNKFRPGQLVSLKNGDEVHVVVSVYEPIRIGTEMFDMDVVTGDYNKAKPAHSYQYEARENAEDQAIVDGVIAEEDV